MAPLAPFVTQRVWQGLVVAVGSDAPGSVHLGAWPTVDETAIDEGLQSAMQLTRRLVELGRAARAEAKLKTRQPLQRALISRAAYARLDPELRAEIAAELNLEALEAMSSDGNDQLVVFSAKANFRALGRRYASGRRSFRRRSPRRMPPSLRGPSPPRARPKFPPISTAYVASWSRRTR